MLAYPPDVDRPGRSHLVSVFVEVESKLPNLRGASWAFAYMLIMILSVVALRAPATAYKHESYQLTPPLVTEDEAVASAFARSLKRDQVAYQTHRESVTRLPEIEDPPTPANDDDLFGGLTRYRATIGV